MDYQKLLKRCKRRPLVDRHAATVTPVCYGQEVISQILPNRDPFLFLDCITGIDLTEQAVIGERKIDPADPLFRGHFPDNPVYPGVLQLEMIAELFCCLYYFAIRKSTAIDDSGPVRLVATRMHDCLLQHGVFPGDDATIITKVLELSDLTYTGIGQLMVNDRVCVAVIGEFYIVE
jgi:3-hydroxyacyl-[acyl-carrier-protein] dehydratase